MRCTFLAFVVLLGACDPSSITVSQAFAGETLPPVARFDNVRIESGIQDQMFPSLTDSTRIQELAGFIDARLDGWEVPWAGPPVGTVYLNLYLGDDFVGIFTSDLDSSAVMLATSSPNPQQRAKLPNSAE